MNVRNRTARPSTCSNHIVQLFDTEESRAHHVASFLAEGIEAGEALIVVAKPVNWALVMEQLEMRGIAVRQRMADGLIVVKDATDTLHRLSRNGVPDRRLFDAVVGDLTVDLAMRTGRRVRAYGEMVDLLAQRGEFPDVIALEALWNDLSERTPLFLLCGYSSAHFVSAGTHRALTDICRAHGDVHRHEHDPLAGWVLTTAHTAPSSLRH